jgi:hypothetical protein
MDKVGFYHHGTLPGEEDAKLLEGKKVQRRNALHFRRNELETFDAVVVDEGEMTKAIKAAYGARKTPVLTPKQFADGKMPKAAAAEPAPFDPDAPVGETKGKAQGGETKAAGNKAGS